MTTAAPTYDPSMLVAFLAPMSLRSVARRLGVDPAVLCRPLTSNQADGYATRLGLHPGEIWGAHWYRPEGVASQVNAADAGCS